MMFCSLNRGFILNLYRMVLSNLWTSRGDISEEVTIPWAASAMAAWRRVASVWISEICCEWLRMNKDICANSSKLANSLAWAPLIYSWTASAKVFTFASNALIASVWVLIVDVTVFCLALYSARRLVSVPSLTTPNR